MCAVDMTPRTCSDADKPLVMLTPKILTDVSRTIPGNVVAWCLALTLLLRVDENDFR